MTTTLRVGLFLVLVLPALIAETANAKKPSDDAQKIKELESKGFKQCKREANHISCQVAPGFRPNSTMAKIRDETLAQYAGYEGGESPIGTFSVIHVLGERSYGEYDIAPEGGATLPIFDVPKEGAKELEKVVAGAPDDKRIWIEGIQANYNTFVPDTYFYDVKNGFLKIKFSGRGKGGWGWIRATEVDRVRGFKDFAKLFVDIHPDKVKALYDAPMGKQSSFGQTSSNSTYSFRVSETKLAGGKFWLKVGFSPEDSCGDGAQSTNQAWVGKWIEYKVEFIEFQAPC